MPLQVKFHLRFQPPTVNTVVGYLNAILTTPLLGRRLKTQVFPYGKLGCTHSCSF